VPSGVTDPNLSNNTASASVQVYQVYSISGYVRSCQSNGPAIPYTTVNLSGDLNAASLVVDAAGNRVPAVDSTTRRNTYYLPIIPMAADDFGVVEPEWPKGAVQPDAWHNPIEQRLEKVLNVLRADNLPGFADWLIALVMLGGVAATIADDIIQAFKTSLQRRNLL